MSGTKSNVPYEDLVLQYAQNFADYLKEGNHASRPLSKTEVNNLFTSLYRSKQGQKFPRLKEVLQEMTDQGWIVTEKNKIILNVPRSSGNRETPRGYVRFMMDQHVKDKRQKAKVVGNSEVFTCPYCHVSGSVQEELKEHLASSIHRNNCLLYWYRTNRKGLMANNKDVSIELSQVNGIWQQSFSEGTADIVCQQGRPNQKLTWLVKNGGKEPILVLHVEFVISPPQLHLAMSDKHGIASGDAIVKILPDGIYPIMVLYDCKTTSTLTAVLGFQCKMEGKSEVFHIVREMNFHMSDDTDDMNFLLPKSPFVPGPKVALQPPPEEIIHAPKKISSSKGSKNQIPLRQYNIPPTLMKLVNHGLKPFKMKPLEKELLTQITDAFAEGLNAKNHKLTFSTLLHIEEHQMSVDIHQFDMTDVTMKQDKRLFILEVLGLAENRPSVLKGDYIYVRTKSGIQIGPKEFEGRVVDVREVELLLEFDQKFNEKYMKNMKFNVRFTFNRFPLMNEHRAIEMSSECSLEKILFPEAHHLNYFSLLCNINDDLRLFNTDLATNPQQLQAVRCVVAGTSRPAPYLIFGPPGTGKTVTMVEAIKQIWRKFLSVHMLVCAPSNAASDLLTTRLLEHIPPSQILRIYAPSRQWKVIPEELKKVSNRKNVNEDSIPAKEMIMKYRIVVTTLITAGRLVSQNFPPDHFTHVFVDEGGQAVEPELLVAVAGILDPPLLQSGLQHGGQLVIAGDPKQLGPVLRSPIAIEKGLGTSFLERLMQSCPLYQRVQGNYNQRVLTKLVKNFRSHPAILYVPNVLFYEGELEACADRIITESMCAWSELPKKNFPVIFDSVEGRDMREGASPSFFNVEEIMKVTKYTEQLLEGKFQGRKLQPKEIGIISPYRRQVQKIREMMRRKRIEGVSVGTTEEFQGQERKVIIISTVRSSLEWLVADRLHALGFLTNPKRMNVAITRSKALLIVVGNGSILARDPHWLRFMRYVQQQGGYRGPGFAGDLEAGGGVTPKPGTEVGDIVANFGAMSLGPSLRELQESPQWRIDM